MAYIGKTPTVGNFQKCDAISVVNGQAAYTLQVGGSNVSPESPNHILVSLNGVLQAPTDSYTVSGATLTFASNLATGDVIDFVILLGNVLDLGVPSDGTVTNAKLASDVISGETDIGADLADADLILVDDGAGGTLRKCAMSRVETYAGNSPNFHAVHASGQDLSNTTWTKINVLTTERFDNGSAYDASNSKFVVPSGEAGVYFFSGIYRMENDSGSAFLKFYKNGSALNDWVTESHGSSYFSTQQNILVNLSESDYIEMYAYINVGNNNGITNISFQGFKVSS